MNLIVYTMTCTCIVMLISICQLPSCNLFIQHVSYLLWRDTTSELWTPVNCFKYDHTVYCKLYSFTLSANKHHFPHYALIHVDVIASNRCQKTLAGVWMESWSYLQWKVYGLGWASKCRVCSMWKTCFPHECDSRV